MTHPLDIIPSSGQKELKYLQPRFPQIGAAPARIILAAPSGAGKSSAAAVLFREYLPICDRVHIVSSTIHLDPVYREPMRLTREHYKRKQIDIDDPQEAVFNEDLSNLKIILAGMAKRTQEAQAKGSTYAPLTYLWIDDLAAGAASNSASYRYNNDIDRLFMSGRHTGLVVCLLTQAFKMLSRNARLQASHIGVWSGNDWPAVREELENREGLSREKLETAFQMATKKPHGFLWIALSNEHKLWSGFTKRLIEK